MADIRKVAKGLPEYPLSKSERTTLIEGLRLLYQHRERMAIEGQWRDAERAMALADVDVLIKKLDG